MGMILRIASSRIVGQGDIVGRSGYFSLNLSANSVMRGRLDARRTLKSLVADLRFNKANPKKPYADALELAESMAKDVEGEIIYCIDDEKIKKSKLKGMSTKNIRSVSVNEMDGTKIVRLETDKYRSDWISVTGVVTDEEGKTIAATVLVKGTNDYTVADADGRFKLKAPKNGILRIADVNKSVAEVKVKPMLKVVLKDK